MTFSYLSILIIIFGLTIGFPYGFKMFCKCMVYEAKVRAYFIIIVTKIKCYLIKSKSFIKLRFVQEYQFIRTKIWMNKYFHKQIKISIKKGELETAKELKNSIKSVNNLEREKFMNFAGYFTTQLAKMLKEETA